MEDGGECVGVGGGSDECGERVVRIERAVMSVWGNGWLP